MTRWVIRCRRASSSSFRPNRRRLQAEDLDEEVDGVAGEIPFGPAPITVFDQETLVSGQLEVTCGQLDELEATPLEQRGQGCDSGGADLLARPWAFRVADARRSVLPKASSPDANGPPEPASSDRSSDRRLGRPPSSAGAPAPPPRSGRPWLRLFPAGSCEGGFPLPFSFIFSSHCCRSASPPKDQARRNSANAASSNSSNRRRSRWRSDSCRPAQVSCAMPWPMPRPPHSNMSGRRRNWRSSEALRNGTQALRCGPLTRVGEAPALRGATPFPNASEPAGVRPALQMGVDRTRPAWTRNPWRTLCAFVPQRLLWILKSC